VPAGAAQTFGGYRLTESCCTLQGTRASIETPAQASFFYVPAHCAAFRSEAERINSLRLIQTGYLLCGPGYGVDGQCSLNNNTVSFVEIYDSHAGFVCEEQAVFAWNANIRYTVQRVDSATWRAYIEGVPVGPVYTWSDLAGPAAIINEGGEYTGDPLDSFSGNGDYGWETRWGRYNTSTGWVQVQQAQLIIDPSNSGWGVFGGPPDTFLVYH
jgi:hypothetical protein